MKASYVLFILAGLSFFMGGTGKWGVIAQAFIIVGLASIGAFLLVNGY